MSPEEQLEELRRMILLLVRDLNNAQARIVQLEKMIDAIHGAGDDAA